MTAEIFLAPHTHWDREWYEPFQRFRLRLVEMLDRVVEQAESDPRFHFTLDGQMAAVDDYLEVRPENRERLRALVLSRQLAIGPWQILLDEFLCSGENIVRNLELGMRRASEFGGVMPVGYLPDMFGHCAQMPQVLAKAGLHHACIWRGVPAVVTRHAFRWEAPDGSSVRAEYLPAGYSNAAYLFTDLDRVDEQISDFVDRMQPWFDSGEILAMHGTDHTLPTPELVDLVTRQRSGATVRVGTLMDYLDGRGPSQEGLVTVRGELRSHARANILPGVLSARTHLKLGLRRAERMVERYAEPWSALYGMDWPQVYLDLAWERLIASSCHDSVTGCGVDETALQVAARIAEAEQAGQAIRDAVVDGITHRIPTGHLVVVNPSPCHRVGWVEVDVTMPFDVEHVVLTMPDGEAVPTQELSRREPTLANWELDADQLAGFFVSIHGHELFGQTVLDADLDVDDRSLTFTVGTPTNDESFNLVALRCDAETAARTGGKWSIRIVEEERRRIAAMVPVPPLGWTALRPMPGDVTPSNPVLVDGPVLDNGLLRVTVSASGVVSVRTPDGSQLDDVARLTDGGDRGDTYNYAPPGTDHVVTDPTRVAIEVLERGALRGVILVHRDYAWPRHVVWGYDRRSTDLVENSTVTCLELRSGEPFLRMELRVDNRCEDHRLRLHVPLSRPAQESVAEGQFAVVSRTMTAEGGGGENPVPTFPAAGFVDAGGVAVLLDRATEYELLSGGTELAVTLLRSIGHLSRNVHPNRPEPAGPQVETPAAQCLGESVTTLAVLVHGGSWHADGVLAAAENWSHDLHAAWATGPRRVSDQRTLSGSGLQVEGDGVVMSSLRRRDDWLELRLVAEHPQPVATTIRGALTAARRCDLLGRPGDVIDVTQGDLSLVLQPWEIVTLQLQR